MKNKSFNIKELHFTDCHEITGNELYTINGGKQVENSNEGVANAQPGDTIIRDDHTEITLNQGDIDWAKEYICGGNDTLQTPTDISTTDVCSSINPKNEISNENQTISNEYQKEESIPVQFLPQTSVGYAEMIKQNELQKQKVSKKQSWTLEYQEKYKEFVVKKIEDYKNLNLKFTCEDLSLSLLIDFANENKLPLVIKNGSGTYDISKYKDIDKYKRKVLSTTAANDLMKNTKPILSVSATKGDLILMDNGSYGKQKDGIMSHTQVIVGKDNGILDIRQGNFTEGKNSRYGSSNYGGSEIQNRQLDTINDIFYGDKKIFKEATNGYGIEYRRWNYDAWNK